MLYLGAFLSTLRPARWYGSRFYPMLAGILLFILFQYLVSNSLVISTETTQVALARILYWSALVLSPLLAIAFAVAALFVAKTRDF